MRNIEANFPYDSEQLNLSLSRNAAEVLSGFLSDFCSNYPRGIQGPIPSYTLQEFDVLSNKFKEALTFSSSGETVNLKLDFMDVANLAALVCFFPYGGERKLILGERGQVTSQPFDSAILDLNEAFMRAGGEDNPSLRQTFEELWKERWDNDIF